MPSLFPRVHAPVPVPPPIGIHKVILFALHAESNLAGPAFAGAGRRAVSTDWLAGDRRADGQALAYLGPPHSLSRSCRHITVLWELLLCQFWFLFTNQPLQVSDILSFLHTFGTAKIAHHFPSYLDTLRPSPGKCLLPDCLIVPLLLLLAWSSHRLATSSPGSDLQKENSVLCWAHFSIQTPANPFAPRSFPSHFRLPSPGPVDFFLSFPFSVLFATQTHSS